MEHPLENELYLINDASYLHIQRHPDRIDYAFYDKETMREIDSGEIGAPDKYVMGLSRADRPRVIDDFDIALVKVKKIPLDFLDKLRTAQLDPPLDEYPMPDANLTVADIANLGYLKGDLLPVSLERAVELQRRNLPLRELAWMGEIRDIIGGKLPRLPPSSTLAVPRKEWEASPMFREAVADRMKHQAERELAFRAHSGDCFAIYQLNHTNPEMRYIRYESLESLQNQGQKPQRENYELVYTTPLMGKVGLNDLWEKFNDNRPADYLHPSMSVSDVVAVKMDGAVTCYYVDSFGYVALTDFLAGPIPQQEQNIMITARPEPNSETIPELGKLRQQLTDRLTENFSAYNAYLLLKDKQELIDGAKQIADTATVYHHMMQRSYSAEELDYLLKFQSPLELVTDYWTDAEVYPDALDSLIADIADRQDDLSLFALVSEERKPDKKEAAQRKERETERPQKLSIKEQLAAKPVPGDTPATKSKNREVR